MPNEAWYVHDTPWWMEDQWNKMVLFFGKDVPYPNIPAIVEEATHRARADVLAEVKMMVAAKADEYHDLSFVGTDIEEGHRCLWMSQGMLRVLAEIKAAK